MILLATCRPFWHQGEPLAHDDRLLLTFLRDQGWEAKGVCWDDPTIAWEQAEMVIVRSTWDYFHRAREFLRWARQVSQVTQISNPYKALAWNLEKHYLRRLEACAVPTIPTIWLEPGKRYDLAALLREQGWSWAVLKPTVSANSHQVLRFAAQGAQLAQAQRHLETLLNQTGTMLQPYLASVSQHGERSHVFLDGQWSHAFARQAFTANTPGHQFAGHLYRAEDLPRTERALAHAIFHTLERETGTSLLYARIDLVTGPQGQPLLMEAEIIEPVLRLEFPGALARVFAGLQARRKKASAPVVLPVPV